MNEESRQWLERANDDLRAADVLLDAGIWNQVCFHAQQCVEKVLKAALVAEGTLYPRSHNLPQLLSLLDASTFEGLPELSDGIRLLDRFYISARYPDVVPGALPSGLPTQQDAVEALDVARRAAAIIESTLTAENAEQAMDSP